MFCLKCVVLMLWKYPAPHSLFWFCIYLLFPFCSLLMPWSSCAGTYPANFCPWSGVVELHCSVSFCELQRPLLSVFDVFIWAHLCAYHGRLRTGGWAAVGWAARARYVVIWKACCGWAQAVSCREAGSLFLPPHHAAHSLSLQAASSFSSASSS
jgi:hypothetical protein